MIETWFSQDLKSAVQVRTICGNVFSMDNNGNKVGVRVTNNGAPVTLSGTISANVIRADGTTVTVAGTASGNEAYVVLPQACYAVPGVITIIIKNIAGAETTTLCAVMANVYQSSTDTAVDPGTVIPSIELLLAQIEAAVSSIPAAGFANGSAMNPNVFNAGDYENGAISETTGANASSSERIRTATYIPTTAKKFYSSDSSIRFMLYLYNSSGTYVGALQSDGTIGNVAGSHTTIEMSAFYNNPSYAGYRYRVVIRKAGGTVRVDTVTGIYIDSYVVDVPQNTADIESNSGKIAKLAANDMGTNVSRGGNINSPVLWEIGGIAYATGEDATNTARARTKNYIPTNAAGISFGTYSSIRGLLLYAYETDGTYVGGYKKSTGTFVTDGSETGYNTEEKPFDIGSFIRKYPLYRFRVQVYTRNSGADVTSAEFDDWTMTNVLSGEGRKIKAIQYNIGKFNWGVEGGLSTNVSEKIMNYKEFLANADADFLFMQEYVQYIDSGSSYAADGTLFTPIFYQKSYSEHETVIFGQHTMNGTKFSYLHTSGDNPAWVIFGETVIEGKTVAVASGALNSSAPQGIDHEEQGIRALTKLTEQILAEYDYAIVGMDCNCLSQSEAAAFLSFMSGKGYKAGNWDYLGYKDTYNLSSTMYKAIDNVFVKGNMKIVNFSVPDVYADLSSDHFPVVAEIRIF